MKDPEREPKRPLIQLKLESKKKTFGPVELHIFSCLNGQGQEIAILRLHVQYRTGALVEPVIASIKNIQLSSEYRGRGYGKSIYLQLLQQLAATPLLTTETLTGFEDGSSGSFQVWQSLVRDQQALQVLRDDGRWGFISIPSFTTYSKEELLELYKLYGE